MISFHTNHGHSGNGFGCPATDRILLQLCAAFKMPHRVMLNVTAGGPSSHLEM
jgi:hypothetical protein